MSVMSLFNSSGPAVRKPTFSISVGSADSELLSSGLVEISVKTTLGPSVDYAEIKVAMVEGTVDVVTDDSVTIELGYEDADTIVAFTGIVDRIKYGIDGCIQIGCVNSGSLLASTRIMKSYEKQTAGDIVNDVAQQVGVTTDTVESGTNYPYYVLDGKRSLYKNVDLLARQSGYVAYITNEDKLYFGVQSQGQAVVTGTYGENLLDLSVTKCLPLIDKATVWGEGAAGSEGEDAWCWLVNDVASVTGDSGNGSNVQCNFDGALRSAESVQSAADGIMDRMTLMQIQGEVLVLGAAEAVIGSTIEITGAPIEICNGKAVVRGVQHNYSKNSGFQSRLWFARLAEGGM